MSCILICLNEPSSSLRSSLGQHFSPRSQFVGTAVLVDAEGRRPVAHLCYRPPGKNFSFSLPSEGLLRYLLFVELKSFGA